ncbi:MAG: phage head closure protein [Selenomonas sp.]|nr:phage head closure protein [Selenomonas sp.]
MYVSLNELKQRITILHPVTEQDAAGNLVEQDRTEVATVWAKVLPYAAKISDGYAEEVKEVDYRIAIRYRADIKVADIIRWQGKTLQQTAPPYGKDGKRQWLILECRELVEDE